ncbi:hypothetical protein AAFF_G00306000 [Aldrovandia affinis]|uniref:Uncharacterized protein n=1 Tax=Aldrovandia affinis TaxID=143900 RepID=A0AAD7SPI1_9TELE|nr:hypothetical protein AAFF_G00306000 [Aldrovandia affinis]
MSVACPSKTKTAEGWTVNIPPSRLPVDFTGRHHVTCRVSEALMGRHFPDGRVQRRKSVSLGALCVRVFACGWGERGMVSPAQECQAWAEFLPPVAPPRTGSREAVTAVTTQDHNPPHQGRGQ